MSVQVLPGLCSVTFRDRSVAEVVALAASNGLVGIEWGADVHVPPGELGTASETARRCADAGIVCSSYGTYLGVDSGTDDIDRAAASALALGSTHLRVWTPFGEDHTTSAARRNEIATAITRLASRSRSHGLTVGIEFHGWTLTHTAASAARLIAEVGADNVFSYWQPNYWDDLVLDDPDRQLDEVEAVLDDLSNVHVYWWRGLERFPLSDGASVVPQALALAKNPGRWNADRFAYLEFVADDDPVAFERDAATLIGWLDELAAADAG